VTGQTNLDVQKTVSLNDAINKAPPPTLPPPDVPPPPPPPPPAPPAIALPDRGIVWGRWTVVAGSPPTFNLANAADQNDLLGLSGNYALLRTRGPDSYVAPSNGSIGFQLRSSEAFVYTDYTPTYRVETPATLSNGVLTVDFGKQSFATSVDMTSQAGNAKLQATGAVGADGQLHGDLANGRTNIMNVQGLLSNQNGGSAAYIFDGRLDDKRTVNGVTYWEKEKPTR
jgi:hypothetical protein